MYCFIVLFHGHCHLCLTTTYVYHWLRMVKEKVSSTKLSFLFPSLGYLIEKGTMVIINNYELNTSPDCWNDPHLFIPERFLTENGKFCKPSHFIPFSNGRRACMGYQLVEKVAADLILGIIQHYDITPTQNPNILPQSCVAIHPDEELRVNLIPRIS